MTRRLLLTYLAITAFVLIVLEVPLGIAFAANERDRLTTKLELDATVVASHVEDALEHGDDPATPAKAAEAYSERTGARVVIVDADGTTIADTGRSGDEFPEVGRDFSSRPEVQTALSGQRANGVRWSDTLGTNIEYVAVPVTSGGKVHGAVRLTYPTEEIDQAIRANWARLGLLAVVVLGTTAAVGTILARSFTRPLHHLEDVAQTLASGDLGARANLGAGPPEIRHLAAAFDRMAERIEDLLAQQRRFTANVSHDLRTPLTALRLRLENLEDSVELADRSDVEAAIAETARLSRLVDRLLTFARAEADSSEHVVEDLASSAHERTLVWTPLAEERDVRLRCEAPSALAVRTVPDAPAQILDNLVANALEAAPAGTEVVVHAAPAGEWVELHVVDAGAGMTQDQRDASFERFWRAPTGPGADTDGSGLGLAIVRQLAQACGGEAGLDEAESGGIDAWVRFRSAEVRA